MIQPLQVLQDIHRFRPDLLLVDLDLKEVSGPDLARAEKRLADILMELAKPFDKEKLSLIHI